MKSTSNDVAHRQNNVNSRKIAKWMTSMTAKMTAKMTTGSERRTRKNRMTTTNKNTGAASARVVSLLKKE